MFKKSSSNDDGLEKVIDDVQSQIQGFTVDAPDFAETLTKMERLYKLKALNKPQRVSPDTLATVAGNLLGILVIVGHERAHVVTSKALTFIKTR